MRKDKKTKVKNQKKKINDIKKEIEALEREFENRKLQYRREILVANKEAEIREGRSKLLQKRYEARQAKKTEAIKEMTDLRRLSVEGEKVVNYLNKENTRIRGQVEHIEEEAEKLREETVRLSQMNAKGGAALACMQRRVDLFQENNEKLEAHFGKRMIRNETISKILNGRNQYIDSEFETLCNYEVVMKRIAIMMEDSCNVSEIVEKVVAIQT